MKNIKLILLCSVVISSHSLFSQQSVEGTIKAGWHKAGTFKDGEQMGESINTFFVGIHFMSNAKTDDVLGVVLGIDYFKNGWEQGDSYRYYHTLSMPIGMRINIGPVFFTGGAAVNFVVTEKRNLSGVWDQDGKIFDFPLFAGAGIQLGPLSIEYKYSWGLIAPLEFDAQKNRYGQLGLGITF